MSKENDLRFEKELKKALRREPAPVGFADRVICQTGTQMRRPWWRVPSLVFANAFTLAAALVGGGVIYRHHEEQRAIEARRQLITALSVTKARLQKAQERIRRVRAKPVL